MRANIPLAYPHITTLQWKGALFPQNAVWATIIASILLNIASSCSFCIFFHLQYTLRNGWNSIPTLLPFNHLLGLSHWLEHTYDTLHFFSLLPPARAHEIVCSAPATSALHWWYFLVASFLILVKYFVKQPWSFSTWFRWNDTSPCHLLYHSVISLISDLVHSSVSVDLSCQLHRSYVLPRIAARKVILLSGVGVAIEYLHVQWPLWHSLAKRSMGGIMAIKLAAK